jgi:hypothetical protein
MDMGLEFITAYYLHGNLVTKKSKIASNYLRNHFFWDSIAVNNIIIIRKVLSFAIRVNIPTDRYRWVYLLFYCRFPSLMNVDSSFEEIILLRRRLRTIYSISKIMLFMFFSFILFGCFFFLLGQWSVNNNYNSWLLINGNFGIIEDMSVH